MNQVTRKMTFSLAHGYCKCSDDCTMQATQIHHKLPQTRALKKLYPLFMDSIFNYCPINHNCHLTKPLPKITAYEASIYEEWLKMFKGEKK